VGPDESGFRGGDLVEDKKSDTQQNPLLLKSDDHGVRFSPKVGEGKETRKKKKNPILGEFDAKTKTTKKTPTLLDGGVGKGLFSLRGVFFSLIVFYKKKGRKDAWKG